MTLNGLTSSELFAVLDCGDLQELETILPPHKYKSLLRHKKTLFIIRNDGKLKPSSLSFIDDMMIPMNLLWGLANIISIGLAATILSIASLGLIPIIGGLYCYYHYNNGKNKIAGLIDFFQLSCVKMHAAEILLERLQNKSPPVNVTTRYENKFLNQINKSLIKSGKNKEVSKVNSIGVSLTSTVTLFGSFFLGISSILKTMGLIVAASAMTGPIGISIAFGVSLFIGMYIGYKHYQQRKYSEIMDSCKSEITHQLTLKRDECHRLKIKNEIVSMFRQNKQYELDEKVPDKKIDPSSTSIRFFNSKLPNHQIVHPSSAKPQEKCNRP